MSGEGRIRHRNVSHVGSDGQTMNADDLELADQRYFTTIEQAIQALTSLIRELDADYAGDLVLLHPETP